MLKRLLNHHQEPRPFGMKTRRLNAVIRFLMALFAIMLIPQGIWAQIEYYSCNGTSGAFEKASATGYTTLENGGDVKLESGTYVCGGNGTSNEVTYSGHITINGTVNIILCDGATLNAKRGIGVGSDAVLNIYGQELGTGVLNASGYNNSDSRIYAAIGGSYVRMNSRGVNRAPGSTPQVNIHGGQIIADSSPANFAAGIGGAYIDFPCSVTVYGGKVTATGGACSAGIGGSAECQGCTVSIYGGEVIAKGGNGNATYTEAKGIGAGGSKKNAPSGSGSDGTLTLYPGATCYGGSNTTTADLTTGPVTVTTRDQYMKTVKSYDLWVSGIQVTEDNRTNIWSGTDISFNPVNSTLHYKDGGSTSYPINSGLPELTIKIGSNDPTLGFAKNNIGAIAFGPPSGAASGGSISATSGNLTISKEDGITGVQQFEICSSGTSSVIEGFENVTYSDFVILVDGANYETSTKKLVDSNGNAWNNPTTFVTADGILPPTMSGDNTAFITTLVLANQMSVGTLKYDVAYVNGTSETNKTYDDNNRPEFVKAATITAYLNINGVNSSSVIGKNFVYDDFAVVYSGADESLTVPGPSPAIATTDGIDFKYTVNPIYESVQSDATGKTLTLKGLGSSDVDVEFLPSTTATPPYTILNPNNKTELWVRAVPKAPTITYDGTKQYLDTDELEMSGISGSTILYTWEDSPGATMTNGNKISNDLTKTNLSIYDSANKPKVQTGTVKAWAVVYEDGEYWIGGESTQAFSIKKDISNYYIADISDMYYTGSAVSPTITVKASTATTTALVENTDYTVSYMQNGTGVSPIGVGTYDVVITGKGNYAGKIASKTFTIIAAGITPVVSITGWTYGSVANAPTVTGNPGNGVITYEYKKSSEDDTKYTATVPTDAGSYTVRATVAATSNYQGGSSTTNFTISRANITSVTVSITGWTYGEAANSPSVTAGNPGKATVKYEYKQQNAGDETYTETVPTNADTYTVRATVPATQNYNGASGTADFTISRANITGVTVSITGWTYGEAANSPSVTAGNPGNATVKYEYKQENAGDETYTETVPTDAETYTVRATVPATQNYKGANGTTTFTIGKRVVVLDWTNLSFDYDGNEHKPTATVSNKVGSDVCTVTVTGGQTNAGNNYTATASALSNNNYTLLTATTLTTNFDINQREVTLTWSNTEFVYDGNPHVPTAEVSNKVRLDACDVTVNGGQTQAGDYTATASALSNNNYKLPTPNPTMKFTIKDRTASITFNAGQKYKTFYSDGENLLVPDNVKAYVVTGVAGNTVNITPISYIHANAPVLLESSSGATTVKDPNETLPTNLLKYASNDVTPNGKQYVLYSGEFVRASGTIPTNKVYLDLSGSSSPARSYTISTDNTTAIEGIFDEEADGEEKWYDMQGRRINKPTKAGLYIKNGQKVVIKNK